MADRLEYPFGSIDVETASRWLKMAPDEDNSVTTCVRQDGGRSARDDD